MRLVLRVRFLLLVLPALGACTSIENIVAQRDVDGLVRHAERLDYNYEAIEHLKLAIAIDPNHSGAWISLGWALYKNKRYGEAAWALEEALQRQPGHAYVLYLSGLTHYHLGELAAARRFLVESLAADPGTRLLDFESSVYEFLGRVALDQGRLAEAEQHFTKAVEPERENWEQYFLRGVARYRQKKYSLAAADYQQAGRLERRPEVWNGLAWALALEEEARGGARGPGAYRTALDAARKAVQLDPDNFLNHVLLAGIYEAQERPQEALAEIRQAVELSPHNAGLRLRLADMLLRAGSAEAAEEAELHLKVGAALDPGWRDAASGEPVPLYRLLAIFINSQRLGQAKALLEWMTEQKR